MTLFPARADLRDPEQPQLVLIHLLDPTRTSADLDAFSGIAPNANFTISKNLLSDNMALFRDEITGRESAALEIVNAWLADPAFLPVISHLSMINQRLETFVSQAGESPSIEIPRYVFPISLNSLDP